MPHSVAGGCGLDALSDPWLLAARDLHSVFAEHKQSGECITFF